MAIFIKSAQRNPGLSGQSCCNFVKWGKIIILIEEIFVKLLSLTDVNTPFVRDMWMFMTRQSIVRILWICFCSTNFKSHINFSQFARIRSWCCCDIDIHSYLWSRLLWNWCLCPVVSFPHFTKLQQLCPLWPGLRWADFINIVITLSNPDLSCCPASLSWL